MEGSHTIAITALNIFIINTLNNETMDIIRGFKYYQTLENKLLIRLKKSKKTIKKRDLKKQIEEAVRCKGIAFMDLYMAIPNILKMELVSKNMCFTRI